jgi:PHD/YefM family antitoxin component YafN of YafNO toxin-antitoxin module
MSAVKIIASTPDDDLLKGDNLLLGETRYAPINEFRSKMAFYVDLMKRENEKILITEHKKPTAAVVQVKEFRILKLLDQAGVSERLSSLTYSDITPEDALKQISRILEDAVKEQNEERSNEARNVFSDSVPTPKTGFS